MKLSISGLSAALAIVSVAEAQNPVRPFPMQPIESAIGVGESFAPQLDQIQLLTAYDSLTMTGIPVGDGSTMALDLERLDLHARRRWRRHVLVVVRGRRLSGPFECARHGGGGATGRARSGH